MAFSRASNSNATAAYVVGRLALSPSKAQIAHRGRRFEIGGIWKKKNQSGGEYLTLSVNTGHGKLNANLGRFPGQDDEELMAVIP